MHERGKGGDAFQEREIPKAEAGSPVIRSAYANNAYRPHNTLYKPYETYKVRRKLHAYHQTYKARDVPAKTCLQPR